MALRLILDASRAMLADLAEYVADLVWCLPEHRDDYDCALVLESLLRDDAFGQPELGCPANSAKSRPGGT
jgi:hypothetical protein